jgi:aminopeptidase-like protein
VALATFLAKQISLHRRRYSYRFLFVPGTIGAITWLCLNERLVPRITHGMVVTCVGDPGSFTYKKSRRGNAEIDKVAAHVLRHAGEPYNIIDFFPYGYDERQFCSPGFNLPVGCLMRSQHGQFPEYHTSADNLDFVRPQSLAESLSVGVTILDVLEHNKAYLNQNPKCEPRLGKRGLYHALGGQPDPGTRQLAMLWVLNLSDGSHTLLDIAERSGLAFGLLKEVADVLVEHRLLQACSAGTTVE